MSKIQPQVIQITLATGAFAGCTRSARTFDDATIAINGMPHISSDGSQYEKIDFTIAFVDGYIFAGSAKIDQRGHVDFGDVSTRYLLDFLSDDPAILETLDCIDPTGDRRALMKDIAEKYDFGPRLAHVLPEPPAIKI